MRKKILLLFLFFLSYFGYTPSAFAQINDGVFDVTVSPIFFEFYTQPGSTISDSLRIRNNTSDTARYQIELKKLGGDPRLGELTLLNFENDSSFRWIKFNSNTTTAKPKEWTTIPFTIKVPADASFGYYWAITVSKEGSSPSDSSGAALAGSSAVPILLVVENDLAKAEAKLAEFKTKQFINEYMPVEFVVKLENTGNIHIRPHGNIFIRSGKNNNLGIIDINSKQAALIPNVKRTFEGAWDDGFLVNEPVLIADTPQFDKNGNQKRELKFNWDNLTNFRIGKYTANLLIAYDNGSRDQTIEATTTFWIIPWKIIGGIIFVILIIFLLMRLLLRSYVNRELRKRRYKTRD